MFGFPSLFCSSSAFERCFSMYLFGLECHVCFNGLHPAIAVCLYLLHALQSGLNYFWTCVRRRISGDPPLPPPVLIPGIRFRIGYAVIWWGRVAISRKWLTFVVFWSCGSSPTHTLTLALELEMNLGDDCFSTISRPFYTFTINRLFLGHSEAQSEEFVYRWRSSFWFLAVFEGTPIYRRCLKASVLEF